MLIFWLDTIRIGWTEHRLRGIRQRTTMSERMLAWRALLRG